MPTLRHIPSNPSPLSPSHRRDALRFPALQTILTFFIGYSYHQVAIIKLPVSRLCQRRLKPAATNVSGRQNLLSFIPSPRFGEGPGEG